MPVDSHRGVSRTLSLKTKPNPPQDTLLSRRHDGMPGRLHQLAQSHPLLIPTAVFSAAPRFFSKAPPMGPECPPKHFKVCLSFEASPCVTPSHALGSSSASSSRHCLYPALPRQGHWRGVPAWTQDLLCFPISIQCTFTLRGFLSPNRTLGHIIILSFH